MVKPGQWAELCQTGRKGEPVWVPLLVTETHDADIVSGVAFFGRPSMLGWSRPVGDFAHVKRGDGNRQWRETQANGRRGRRPKPEYAGAADVQTGEVTVTKTE